MRMETVRLSITIWFEALGSDLRSAVRSLQHSRRYTGWVVGSLAIGMAVTIAALALLNAVMFSPFPGITDQPGLVRVNVTRNCGSPDCWNRMSSAADYASLQQGLHGLQGLAAYTDGLVAAALPEARSLRALVTSANYFDVLGVHATTGRLFNANDAQTHAAVAIIAYSVWTREFASDPSVVGRSIRVANDFVQIVGVAPQRFGGIDRVRPGDRDPDIWLPMWLADRVLPFSAAERRRQERLMDFVGRLRQGVDVRQVQAQAEVLASQLALSRGHASATGRADVRPVWRVNPRNWKFGFIIVMPIPILVLVIACVNAANLMLARGSQRQREMAIRLAIGARRGRIVRQLLIESALLAAIATTVAILIAWWGLQLATNPWDIQIPFDPAVLGWTVLTAVCTTLAFGLAPAVRVSAQKPSSTLGSGSARTDSAPRQSRTRRMLIVSQVALSLGLLATAWQLVATVRGQALSSGAPGNQLLLARFDLQPLNLAGGGAEAFYEDLASRASRLPGVEAAGVAGHTVVWTFGQGAGPASMVVWNPTDRPDEGRVTIGGYAGGTLFDAVGLRVVAGRDFTDAERRQARPQVAVVNQAFATRMNGPVVGSVLRVAPRDHAFATAIDVRIVGVIEAAVEPRYEEGVPAAKVYLPAPLEPEPALTLYVRTHGAANALAQPVRELVGHIAPRVPILDIGSLDEFNERSFGQQLWLARGAAVLGVIGLLLATAGLYGVSSYVVTMRSREIAIRMAIGARPGAILAMMLRQSMRIAAIGLVFGAGAAVVASRAIQSGYYGVRGIDAMSFGGAMALFVAAMLLASTIPAVRASRVDPVENLKDA
jgi:putative ABC transport system permease protein